MVQMSSVKHWPCRAQSKTNTERLFEHLHRGGAYAHLWTDASHQSYWFAVNQGANRKVRRVPRPWLRHNVYFSVHPLSQIPPQNSSGNTEQRYISSQLAYIAAINTLFAEYDGKDYVDPMASYAHLPENFGELKPIEQRHALQTAKEAVFYGEPARYKARALAVIEALYFPPSVIVDSGGGYHCYWLLHEAVPVDEANRSDVQAVQHSWVQMVGADPSASDLRRMLRVPGSYNMKPGFGHHHPKVVFYKIDFNRLYHYNELEEAVNDWLFANRPKRTSSEVTVRQVSNEHADLRTAFNREHSLVDLLVAHGYQVSYRSETMTRLARPGREKRQSSVTVFAAKEDGAPELAVHFSSNDPLYSAIYIDPESGQSKRYVHDAFAAYVLLEHGGDWQAAYRAVQS